MQSSSGGLGHLEEKMFNALVTDYIDGWPPEDLTFVTTNDGSTVTMLVERLAPAIGVGIVSMESFEQAVRTYTRPSVMLALHDEDPAMLTAMDICRELSLDPMDLCIGLIPLFELMDIK